MTFTRRELAAAVAAGAAALGRAAANNQAASPTDALRQAETRVREDGQALAKYQVPMTAAPAFIFEA